jgi:hypothetical protein
MDWEYVQRFTGWLGLISVGGYVVFWIAEVVQRWKLLRDRAERADRREAELKARAEQNRKIVASVHAKLTRVVARRPLVDGYRLVGTKELAREPGARLSRN